MKLLFENWRKFLKEEEAIEKLYKALGEDQQKIFKTLTVEQQLGLAMEWSQDGMPGGLLMEGIEVDFEVGDVILGGKYKNKRMVVKEIGKDELGQPTVNGKPMLKFRIEKHLPDNKKSKKTLDAEKEEKEKLDEAKVSKSVLKTLRDWPKGWRGGESPGKYYGNFKKSDWTADDKGYIEDKGRGFYVLSDLGREILAANPPEEEKVNDLNEIGDASAEPFDWHLSANDEYAVEYDFVSSDDPMNEGSDYIVKFGKTEIWKSDELVKREVPAWALDYEADGAVKETGEGHPLRIMSTVVAIVKHFISRPKLNRGILDFVFEGIDKRGEIGGEDQTTRTKMYLRFLEKHLPDDFDFRIAGQNVIFFGPKDEEEE